MRHRRGLPASLIRAAPILLVLLGACERRTARLAPGVGVVGQVQLEGRIIEPEDDDPTVPWTSLSEDEVPDLRLEWKTDDGEAGPARSDDEGFVRFRLPPGIRPGRHQVHLRDARKRRLGTTTALVLRRDSAPRIVLSDVDLTYLDTAFGTATEILGLLRMSAVSHEPLAGMPDLYRGLRVTALLFLSGSPEFFRGHLQARLGLDGIRYDALWLKPAKDVATREILAGRPEAVEEALREQVGYKLAALLAARVRLPRRAEEVLLGDDSEMDAWAYHLYREASSGRLDAAGLRRELEALGVGSRAILECLRRLQPVRVHLGDHETVRAIFIRRTERPNSERPATALVDRGVRLHRTSTELAESLAEMDWLRTEAVAAVRAAERRGR